MLFYESGSAHAKKNSGIFHDSTRPHLHSDGLTPKSRRSVISIQDLGCVTSITEENIVVLVWPGAAHAPISRSKSAYSVFRIGVCKILSKSVEIWQYEGQKPVFE